MKLADTKTYAEFIAIGGIGGNSTTAGGGAGGKVSGIALTGLHSTLNVTGGSGGSGATSGGAGGLVENVTGKMDILRAIAGDGGDGTTSTGNGGAGGDTQKINATVARFAQMLRGGAGGNAGASAIGGLGGSVKDSTIIGDIGNFGKGLDALGASQFGIGTAQMGGLFAGTGGTGGTPGAAGGIVNVTATRIAAILAVNQNTTASSLTTANAVTQINNVHATVFGADNVNAGIYDFVDNVGTIGFVLGDGDTAIDGLIIVKSGGLITPITPAPLKLIIV